MYLLFRFIVFTARMLLVRWFLQCSVHIYSILFRIEIRSFDKAKVTMTDNLCRPTRRMCLSPSQEQSTKERIMVIRKTEVDKFLSILTMGNVRLLMEKDKCCNYIDNYLLATVLVYFKRAGLDIEEYTEENFWRCLYLAHDQEEDEEELKWELLAWAMGDTWKKDIKAFLIAKDAIWKKMDYRSVVSRKQCEQIMNLSGSGHSGVWSR